MAQGPEVYSDDEGVVLKRRSVKLTLIDSDDDDHAVGVPSAKTTFGGGGSSSEDDSEKENSNLKANRKSKKRVVTPDSGSDSDDEPLENFEPEAVDCGEPPKKISLLFKDKDLYDDETSDHESAVTVVPKYTLCRVVPQKSTRKEDLNDAEGSDGEFKPDGYSAEEDKMAKKPAKKLESRKAKSAAMAGIELIHSETQRLLRESRLSLPYHRPKQHTITEFLQRRSVQATKELDTNSRDLSLIWKELEERTKEAEAFYKSDSEDSDAETEKQPLSQDATGDAGASASDALKDSGILSMTNSFSSEASPVDGDSLPLEVQGACLKCEGSTGKSFPVSEGLLLDSGGDNCLAVRRSEVSGAIQKDQSVTNCVDIPPAAVDLGDLNKGEAEVDPPESSQNQEDPISPQSISQHLEQSEEGTKVQETSPDLFLSQRECHTVRVEDQTAALDDDKLSHETARVETPPSNSPAQSEAVPERSKPTPRSVAAILISKLGDIKPQLSCGRGDVVDLTSDSTPKRGVDELISRFMKQSGSKPNKPKENSKVGISVVSVENDTDGLVQVKSDTVFVTLDDGVTVVDPALAKPGAKLQRLKEELNKTITKQREEEWAKRQLEFKIDEEIDDEKSVCGLLDDDREAELSESESEEEDEEEEDEIPIVEKKRTKSAFLDDEAEVSEDDEVVEEDEEDDDEVKSEAQGADTVGDTEEEEETLQAEDTSKKSKLRRIKTFDMFETDEEESEDDEDFGNVSTVSTLNIPPYQPGGAITQPAKEEPGSITPLLKVPALKGVMSEPNLNDRSPTSPCEPTQAIEHIAEEEVIQAKKNLFNRTEFSTQENMAELMDVCSGTFSGKAVSELMGLCSGNFLTQPVNIESLEKDDENALAPSFPEELEDTQPVGRNGGGMASGLAGLVSGSFPTHDDKSLPHLHASEEPEDTRSLQRFYSEDSRAQFPDKSPDRRPRLRLTLISSDEEADEENKLEKKKKRKENKKRNMQLYFSDEEDAGTSERTIGYDSEENEIDLEEEEQKTKAKATEFFEDEAELSESEWGSEDEDEQDLDKLEWEEGDAEKLNEKKVREQLEKIHMRRVLDDDQREVRILQELLLEDGEFHSDGPGRERKFRWKNMNIVETNQVPRDSDDENAEEGDEEEDEAEWRKRRFERETFLMEQKEKAAAAGRDSDDDLDADMDSQLLQLGKAALKRMRSFNSEQGAAAGGKKKVSAPDLQVSPNPKYPFKLLTKRGSFLARSEVALARIAHITRGAGATVVNGPKHSRNFVFTTLSPEKAAEPEVEHAKPGPASFKRKSSATVSAPLLKKPRLTRGKGLFDHLEL